MLFLLSVGAHSDDGASSSTSPGAGEDGVRTEYLERTKLCIIGEAKRFPRSNLEGSMNTKAACCWDCYRRASMLEPLAARVFADNVPGDFMEAGVFKGGIAIFMTALLVAHDPYGKRTMWFADSFSGLPPVDTAVNPRIDALVAKENKRTKWVKGRFVAKLATVQQHFAQCYRNETGEGQRFGGQRRARALPGYFRDVLPGPVRTLALLRIDGDLYISIMDALERLYDRLSVGGWVVFDDWKFDQARAAITDFRERRGINAPLLFSNGTLDPMVYWRKPMMRRGGCLVTGTLCR